MSVESTAYLVESVAESRVRTSKSCLRWFTAMFTSLVLVLFICAGVLNKTKYAARDSSDLKETSRGFRAISPRDTTITPDHLSPRSITDNASLYISVKTTKRFHATRVRLILDTWFNLGSDETFFFTDSAAQSLAAETGAGHWINTKCPATHTRQALCCKLGAEYNHFIESDKRWWCHFDDDNYVNIPVLKRTLAQYDPAKDWYLGKPSTSGPIRISDPHRGQAKSSFWFATGGAGFCISRPLATKLMPYARNNRLMQTGNEIRLPDDVTMGYLIESVIGRRLTVLETFHSHLENLQYIPSADLPEQISLSYGYYNRRRNVISLANRAADSRSRDPTNLRALHCQLYPRRPECTTKSHRTAPHR